MKYFIVFIFTTYLFSSNYEARLYEMVFTKLFDKKMVKVYSQDKNCLSNSEKLHLVDCRDADIVLVSNLSTLQCKYKPLFVTSYIDYINSEAIGAFYWRKGRPQLILNKKLIKKYNLYLDKSLEKYAK